MKNNSAYSIQQQEILKVLENSDIELNNEIQKELHQDNSKGKFSFLISYIVFYHFNFL